MTDTVMRTRNSGHAIGLRIVDRFLRKAQVECIRADDEKLTDLFFQRQRIGGLRLYGRCRCRGGRWGGRWHGRIAGAERRQQNGQKKALFHGIPPFRGSGQRPLLYRVFYK